jgi:hypothetical protein
VLYEIRDGIGWAKSLAKHKLSEVDLEDLRESLDWTLSRKPYANPKWDGGVITLYFESFKATGNNFYLVFYRIEGSTVVLEEIERDYSRDF